MLQRRTDLALEAAQLWQESAGSAAHLEGVTSHTRTREGYAVTVVQITSEQGAQTVGKPQGTYVTLELDGLIQRTDAAFPRAVRALAGELADLLDLPGGAPVLVAGLGNRAVTPDGIGPKAADCMLVTRHLVEQVPEHFGAFRPVAALAAGVLGTTGIESGELLAAAVERIHPACVIAIDALASRSLRRVGRTIQLTDTGIVPGSGVGNARTALTQAVLGVPVLAIGVPTVVDAATLACDLLAEAGRGDLDPAVLAGAGEGLIVTPKEVDTQVDDLSKVIGYGVSLALQPGLELADLELLLA